MPVGVTVALLAVAEDQLMSMFSADIHDLRELYVGALQHVLSSETQIAEEGLPAMIKNATNPSLREAFEKHLVETKNHAAQVRNILSELRGSDRAQKCKATAGLISQASDNMSNAGNDSIRDVVVIAAGNQVEHFEIATYGTLRTWATLLGENEQAAILDRILEEEKKADKALTELSENINLQAPVDA